jgi:hypothetical protein
MKSLTRFFLIVILALLAGSCNNDFLKNDELIYYTINEPLVISSQQPQGSISFHLPEAGDRHYYIRTHPKWMDIEPMQGRFSGGAIPLLYTMSQPEYQTGDDYYSGWLEIMVEDVGYYQVEVLYGHFDQSTDTIGNGGNGNGGQEPPIANNGRVSPIKGIVTDALYDKSGDLLVIATKSPNQLLIRNTQLDLPSTMELDKSPQCLELTPDGKLLVGYTVAYLSVVNIQALSLEKTYTLNCVPFDLAAGDNGWCYISPSGSDFDNLRNLNLETGEITQSSSHPSHHFYGGTWLMRVKDQPYLLASRTSVSPTGVLLFDISQGLPKDTIAYWHEDLQRFWPMQNGQHMLTTRGKVYFIPAYTTKWEPIATFDLYGELNTRMNFISSFDESESTNSLFVAEGTSVYKNYSQQETGLIEQFDATNLNRLNSYPLSPYEVDEFGNLSEAELEVWYVFVNSQGKELYALRRNANEAYRDRWSLEVFEVE